jgi:hypothetical protein
MALQAQAERDRFTRQVSFILEDPVKLGNLLAALGLDMKHYPKRGCFIGRCPLCNTPGNLYVRYTDTETSTYPVFWTCRNEKCKSRSRHSSALGLVREVLRLNVKGAMQWLANHLGYAEPGEILALPEPTPSREAVLTDRLDKVAAVARKGYTVYYARRNKLNSLNCSAMWRYKTLNVDSTIFDSVLRWLEDNKPAELPSHFKVKRVTIQIPSTEFRTIRKHRGCRLGADSTVIMINKHTGTWRVLEPKLNKEGYAFVEVTFEGKVVRYRVDKLVLETFVGPAPGPGMIPVHRDGQPGNNIVSNLMWGEKPKRDNKGERHGRSKLTEADVVEMFSLFWEGKTKTEIAKLMGVSLSAVSLILNRKTWTHVVLPEQN